jgi:hypothetical protein
MAFLHLDIVSDAISFFGILTKNIVNATILSVLALALADC